MPNALTDGQVAVNDRIIAVMPNSITRRHGRGTTNVRTQSLGNGNIDTVHSTDLESAKSYFKMSIMVTSENIDLVDSWKINPGENTIRYSVGGRYDIFEQMSVINDPEIPDSNDGVIEVEFEGRPLPL